MAVRITDLCIDLDDETAVLVDQLRQLDDSAWATPTPAAGWTVKDQIGHLAFFDGAVVEAVTDPHQFRSELAESSKRTDSLVDAITNANRHRSGAEVLGWFCSARAAMTAAFKGADPTVRVPWYGPDMSVASALTARIMETWAHGQDVFDGLGVRHPVTGALRQVAHIGVRALPNSYITKGQAVPTDPVRVALVGPDDSLWVWGPDDASNRVTGLAEEFCLVVTQRRHLSDTNLLTTGSVAAEWMSIAQAFAGPPGGGRAPGQFSPL